jgi:hypothetical protein
MVSQQDVVTNYNDVAASSKANRAVSWVGMYNRTAGRLTIVPGIEQEAPPAEDQRRRLRVIEQLLSKQ